MKSRILILAALAMLFHVALLQAQEAKTYNLKETKVPFHVGVVSNATIVTARYDHWLRGKMLVDTSQTFTNGRWHLAFQVVYTKAAGYPEQSDVSWKIPGVVASNNIDVIRKPDGQGTRFGDQSNDKANGISKPTAGQTASPAAGDSSAHP